MHVYISCFNVRIVEQQYMDLLTMESAFSKSFLPFGYPFLESVFFLIQCNKTVHAVEILTATVFSFHLMQKSEKKNKAGKTRGLYYSVKVFIFIFLYHVIK